MALSIDCRRALVAALIVPTLLLSGCIGGPPSSNGDGTAEELTVIIVFEGFDPDTFPDKVAMWESNGDGNWTLTTEEAGEEGVTYTIRHVEAATVLDALVEAGRAGRFPVEHHKESQGAYVDSIDGVENGREGHFWSFYLNDEYGLVASDAATVEGGDQVRWVSMGNPFG